VGKGISHMVLKTTEVSFKAARVFSDFVIQASTSWATLRIQPGIIILE